MVWFKKVTTSEGVNRSYITSVKTKYMMSRLDLSTKAKVIVKFMSKRTDIVSLFSLG